MLKEGMPATCGNPCEKPGFDLMGRPPQNKLPAVGKITQHLSEPVAVRLHGIHLRQMLVKPQPKDRQPGKANVDFFEEKRPEVSHWSRVRVIQGPNHADCNAPAPTTKERFHTGTTEMNALSRTMNILIPAYLFLRVYDPGMELVQIHECLCDRTRLRILHLLLRDPLCVCHIQSALREPQVKISRHLAYMRRRGMIECRRNAQWMVYSLPEKRSPLLDKNLLCLQDCFAGEAVFRQDLARLEKLKCAGDCLPSAPARSTVLLQTP